MENILTNPPPLFGWERLDTLQHGTAIAEDGKDGTYVIRNTDENRTEVFNGRAPVSERHMGEKVYGTYRHLHPLPPLLRETMRGPYPRLQNMVQEAGNNHVFVSDKRQKHAQNINRMLQKRYAGPMLHRTIGLLCRFESPTDPWTREHRQKGIAPEKLGEGCLQHQGMVPQQRKCSSKAKKVTSAPY